MDVLHTAIWIDDVEAMKAFYHDGLDLEYSRSFVGDDGVTNYFLAGESETELQFKYVDDPDGGPDVDPAGFDHTAIAVEEIDETVETLVDEYGGAVTQGPTTMNDLGVRIAFVDDPDGYGVELIESLE